MVEDDKVFYPENGEQHVGDFTREIPFFPRYRYGGIVPQFTSQTIEEYILDFDVMNSSAKDALNFIAWLQVELMNEK